MIKWVQPLLNISLNAYLRNIHRLVLYCFLFVAPTIVLAIELEQKNLTQGVTDLTGQALILHDPNYQHSPESAAEKFNTHGFKSDLLDTNGKHYWFYLPVHNLTEQIDWTLSSSNTLVDDFNYFWRCNDEPLKQLERPKIGFSSESIATSYHVKLTIPQHHECVFLQEVSVSAIYPLQNYLMPSVVAAQRSNVQTILCILAFGIIIGLMIYNLLLSISLLSLNYLLYSLYAFLNLSSLVLITFRPFSSIYEHWPAVNSFRVTDAGSMLLFIVFTIGFMRPGLEQAKRGFGNEFLLRVCTNLIKCRFLPCAVMIGFILEPFISPNTLGLSGKFYPLAIVICSLYIPIISLAIALTGYRPAFVFFIAWAILMGGNISGFLDLLGVIELNGWARTIAIVGASIEMILLSIVFGMNVRGSQNEKNRALREREDAKLSMERQDKFVSTLSHEIRTPLHAILGATNLLAKTELSATQKDYWNTTHYAAESMHALVDNLLDRAEAKNTQRLNEKVSFDPKRLFEAMVQLLKPRAIEKKIPVTLTMHSIPDYLLGNPLVIRRILINIISNSIKYTDHGNIDINVVWQETNRQLKIIISDTGKGISETHLTQLNTRFNKGLESHYSEESSSGLGLAICHELISNSGGQLTIQSELNTGTTVTVELDLDHAPSSATQTSYSQSKPPQSLNACVLVVDDIASNRLIVEQIIKQLGCNTLSATNGIAALKVLATNQIDILISDLRMPEMDGIELLKALKQTKFNGVESLRIVITSAHLDATTEQELLALGADICLAKPYRPEELESVMTNLLVKHSKVIHDNNSGIAVSVEDSLGAEVYAEAINLFRQQTAEDLRRIQQGVIDQDFCAISVAAHRIVSASKALGFARIADVATKIEDACTNEQLSPTNLSVKRVAQYLPLLIQKIETQIRKYHTS